MSDLQKHMNESVSVLIVDDNMNNLQVLGSILRENHYNVMVARDGDSALRNIQNRKPEIILLDIMMPEIDGFEVCQRLRQQPETAFIPIIFLSAKNDTESIVKGFNLGGNDYLTKPFIKDELLARIRNQLLIRQTTSNLEKMLHAKDAFFKIIAHDLKTPVNSQINYADLLVSNLENYGAEKVKLFLKMIYETAVGQYRLLENILEWSRMQQGGITPEKEPVLLVDPIIEAEQLHKSIIVQNELAFSIDVGDEQVFADRRMLDTILRNLISNAVKYTTCGGTVKVYTKVNEEEVAISVQDNGPGMSSEQLEKLFTNLENSRAINKSGKQGSGIGLLLCKEFVELNGGHIEVESEQGKGSLFTFTLSRAKD